MGHALKQLHYLDLARIVKEGSRFVKEYYRCLLCEGFSYHHFLSLPVAQGLYLPCGEFSYACQLERAVHNLAVLARVFPPETCVRAAAQPHELPDGHVVKRRFLGKHHTDGARKPPRRIIPQRAVGDCNAPVKRRNKRSQRFQEGGFSCTIGSEQASKLRCAQNCFDMTGYFYVAPA